MAAWSLPVVAVTVSTPLASASTITESDLVLSFGDVTEGSTRDISFAVISFIESAIRSLGPAEPVAPELVLPPEPVRPSGFPNPLSPVWQQYFADYAQWVIDVAEANAGHLAAVAQYLEDLATWTVWDAAVREIVRQLQNVAIRSEGIFFASATYPRTVRLVNAGPDVLPAGSVVTVQLQVDSNLVNAYLPEVGPVQIIQTGGTTTLSYVVPADVPAGGEVFSQPLVYNPASVTLNITGMVEQSSVTALLAPASQDTDINDNGDMVTSPIGIRLDVATDDVQEILDEWRTLIDNAIEFYEFFDSIGLIPEFDWRDIISGRLPIIGG